MLRFLFLAVLLAGCHNVNTRQGVDSTIVPSSDTTGAPVIQDTIIPVESFDTIIHIQFLPGDSAVIRGKMQGVAKPVTVLIPVEKAKQLVVAILPEDSIANIRINQIFTPDGKADGPFGRELTHPVRQQGTYKIVLAENMMQGNEWKGHFKLKVKLVK